MAEHINASAEAQRIRLEFAGDEHCHAGRDGDCTWTQCPQERANRKDYQSYCCPLARDYEDL